MTYKYVSIGMSLGGTKGIVSYLHEKCATHLNMTLGPKAVPFEGDVPVGVKCPWCGETVEDEQ